MPRPTFCSSLIVVPQDTCPSPAAMVSSKQSQPIHMMLVHENSARVRLRHIWPNLCKNWAMAGRSTPNICTTTSSQSSKPTSTIIRRESNTTQRESQRPSLLTFLYSSPLRPLNRLLIWLRCRRAITHPRRKTVAPLR